MADLQNILQQLGIGAPPQSWMGNDPNQIYVNPSAIPSPYAGDTPAAITAQMQPQQVQQPVNAMQGPPDDVGQPQMQPQSVQQLVAPLRQRASLLDIIGHIGDSLAAVGDQPAIYQGFKDQALARSNAAEDRLRAISSGNLANQKTQQEILASQATAGKTNQAVDAGRYGAALRGLQAIQKANPNADLSQVWPILAHQAGIDPIEAQHLFSVIQQNPSAIDGLAAEYEKAKAGGNPEFGKSPSIATNAKGERIAYQVDSAGNFHQVALPPGFSPADSFNMVDAGGNVIPVSRTTALPGGVPIAKTTTPEGNADRTQKQEFHDNPLPKTPPVTLAAAFTSYRTARESLTNLIHGMEDLAKDPGLASATGTQGQITRHLPSGLGGAETQRILAKIETLKGKTIPTAINQMRGLDGKLGFRPSQTEVLGDAKGLTGALDSTKQSQADYVASINSNLQQLYSRLHAIDADALRNQYVEKGPDGKLRPVTQKQPTLSLPPRAGKSPTVSNWN